MVHVLIQLHRAVLLAVLAVALVATGYAHRMPGSQDEALAFALENGVSLTDICGGSADSAHPGTDCQACQISAAADLPYLAGARIDLEPAFHATAIAPLEIRAILHAPDPAHRPQGPPVVA